MHTDSGEITIHLYITVFPTRAPEQSEKFLRQMGWGGLRWSKNEGQLDRNIFVGKVTLVKRVGREGRKEKEKEN